MICKIEGLLDIEIQKLPTTLQILPPEKRVDFISKTLPVVVKYRENHSGGGEKDRRDKVHYRIRLWGSLSGVVLLLEV